MCNGKAIPIELMDAVAVYSIAGLHDTNKDTYSKQEQEFFVQNSEPHLTVIKQFMQDVPLRALGVLAHNAIDWSPPRPTGAEDWYVVFKNQWKKNLDSLWNQQSVLKQKVEVTSALKDAFNIASLPLLPARPWSFLWGGLPFEFEYSFGFVHFFFKRLYPNYEPVIKTLVLEGTFVKKENGIQLSEIMHEFTRQVNQINAFNANIADNGPFGAAFAKAGPQTIQNQQKVNSIMQKIAAEAASIIKSFTTYCPTIIELLKGVISESKNPRYDTISNFTVIQGNENEAFRQKIWVVRNEIDRAFELLGRIQVIPTDADMEIPSDYELEAHRHETDFQEAQTAEDVEITSGD
jgi:hypothetical protein